ncbi:MAG: hypothetical protein ACAI25_03840 [Planctomycetota bacterium]
MRVALGLVAIALACGAPRLASAQDGAGAQHRHCPTCGQDLPSRRCPTCGQGRQLSDEDRELDRVLRREYGDPNGPPRRRLIETPPPEPVPPPPPVNPNRRAPSDDDSDREFYVNMGVLGAHWAARLSNARVSSARGGFHGDNVGLTGGQLSGAELDGLSNTQLLRGWIDLGPWFSLDGGANRAFFRDSGQSTRDFVFRGQQFNAGQVLETKFNALIADFNFVVHPVHGRWGRLDVSLGLRYMYAQSQFRDTGLGGSGAQPQGVDVIVTGGGGAPLFIPGPGPSGFSTGKVKQTNEAVIPMVGIGGAFRPVHEHEITIEIFGRARVGGFDWEERGYSYRRDRWVDRRFYAYSAELDGGVSIILFGTLGVTGGYHFDLAHIERRDMGESDSSDWNAHGPYMGAFLQF